MVVLTRPSLHIISLGILAVTGECSRRCSSLSFTDDTSAFTHPHSSSEKICHCQWKKKEFACMLVCAHRWCGVCGKLCVVRSLHDQSLCDALVPSGMLIHPLCSSKQHWLIR